MTLDSHLSQQEVAGAGDDGGNSGIDLERRGGAGRGRRRRGGGGDTCGRRGSLDGAADEAASANGSGRVASRVDHGSGNGRVGRRDGDGSGDQLGGGLDLSAGVVGLGNDVHHGAGAGDGRVRGGLVILSGGEAREESQRGGDEAEGLHFWFSLEFPDWVVGMQLTREDPESWRENADACLFGRDAK